EVARRRAAALRPALGVGRAARRGHRRGQGGAQPSGHPHGASPVPEHGTRGPGGTADPVPERSDCWGLNVTAGRPSTPLRPVDLVRSTGYVPRCRNVPASPRGRTVAGTAAHPGGPGRPIGGTGDG